MNITNEDNMELMARYEDNHFDLAIVDPPYGIKDKIISGGETNNKIKLQESLNKWDVVPPKQYWIELKRVSKNQIICGGNYFVEHLTHSRGWVVWDKVTRNTWADGELIYTSFNTNLRIFKYSKADANINDKENLPRIHPTQKPVKLYEWLLMNYAKEGDKILDTHLGGGSIAIACHNLGFDLTACELDKDYYDAAIKRLKNHQLQTKLF